MIIERVKGSGMSDGLRHAFQQGPKDENDTHPRDVPTPTGLNPEDENEEKAFVSPNHNGNLYNTENDTPVVPDATMIETGSNRKERDMKRLDRVKLNDHVSYSFGEGTIVGKQNMMVQIANDDTKHIDYVPIGETYFKDDILASSNVMTQMWDMMVQESRSHTLTKANILGDTQKAYLYRDWDDIPNDVQSIIKETFGGTNYYDEPPHGGVEGREPSHNDRNEESRSHRDLTQPPHVTAPYKDDQAPGAKKSDVEHNVLGGVVTDTPIDATDEYEDDRPKSKPLSGAQEDIAQGPSGISGGKPSPAKEPLNPKDKPHDAKWSEEHKADPITGAPDDKDKGLKDTLSSVASGAKRVGEAISPQGISDRILGDEGGEEKSESNLTAITGEKTKDEDVGVRPESAGFQGASTNAQSKEKTLINKHNTRYGPRQASEEDIKRLTEGNL